MKREDRKKRQAARIKAKKVEGISDLVIRGLDFTTHHATIRGIRKRLGVDLPEARELYRSAKARIRNIRSYEQKHAPRTNPRSVN